MLDTWELEIDNVTEEDGTDLPFELGEHDAVLGQALTVRVGTADRVVVHYATGSGARALQWLEPAQTASGKPFLFSQAQPILARTWLPCQDSPAVRMTYDATLQVPPDLLAADERRQPGGAGERRPLPVRDAAADAGVPGRARGRRPGVPGDRRRSGVYAEPSVVDGAAWEFAEVEEMIAAAERLYGPYRWGRYDMLVLPPSFPYGGMENPRLTFVTPTILAGDRSLVSLIAHELAHSWSGNLVTNSTWNDVWLNEGFTVYFETRIDEELYGDAYTRMLLRLGRQKLDEEVAAVEPRDTWLELDRAGKDPDGPGTVPYEKGSLLLRLVEQSVGRERFDAFLRGYFDRYAFTSMDTATFVDHLRRELLDPAGVSPEELRLEEWVHGPGVPDNAPHFASDAFDIVDGQVAALTSGRDAAELETDGWVSHQWVHFVRGLPRDLPVEPAGRGRRSVRAQPQRQHRGRHRVAGAGDRGGLRVRGPRPGRGHGRLPHQARPGAVHQDGLREAGGDGARARAGEGDLRRRPADVPLGVAGRRRPDPRFSCRTSSDRVTLGACLLSASDSWAQACTPPRSPCPR